MAQQSNTWKEYIQDTCLKFQWWENSLEGWWAIHKAPNRLADREHCDSAKTHVYKCDLARARTFQRFFTVISEILSRNPFTHIS